MNKTQTIKAIKKASRIFAYVRVRKGSSRPYRISKNKALALFQFEPDDAVFNIEYADDDQKILLIG